MKQAKNGDTVKVHYTGKLEDGLVFDTSKNREPIQFTIGEGKVLKGLENAVIDMNPSESKTVTIQAAEAYGSYRDELAVTVERKELPENLNVKVGQRLHMTQPNNQKIVVTITDISEGRVTLDANHPLAGKDLTFDIQLVEIV